MEKVPYVDLVSNEPEGSEFYQFAANTSELSDKLLV